MTEKQRDPRETRGREKRAGENSLPHEQAPVEQAFPPAQSGQESLPRERKSGLGSSVGRRFPRVFLLPTIEEDVWAVPDEPDLATWAAELKQAAPVILAQGEKQKDTLDSADAQISAALSERVQESVFDLISRLAVGGIWVLVALVGLRLPGWLELFDMILLALGLGFTGYAIMRYGSAARRWQHRKIDAKNGLLKAQWVKSPLIERIAAALQLRGRLDPSQHGQLPDAELLDANAYRKLIAEGVTSRAELCALGQAVTARMGLQKGQGKGLKISDIARKAGLDIDTAIFYRDLAMAASEIELDQHSF